MLTLIDLVRTVRGVWLAALRGISWQLAVAGAALFVAVGTAYESKVSEIAQYILMGSLTGELFKQYSLKMVIPWVVQSGRSVGGTRLLPLMLVPALPVGLILYFSVRFVQEPRGHWGTVFMEFDPIAVAVAVILPFLGITLGGGSAILSYYHGQNKSAVLEGKELTRRERWLTALFFMTVFVLTLISPVRRLVEHFN